MSPLLIVLVCYPLPATQPANTVTTKFPMVRFSRLANAANCCFSSMGSTKVMVVLPGWTFPCLVIDQHIACLFLPLGKPEVDKVGIHPIDTHPVRAITGNQPLNPKNNDNGNP